MSWGSHIIFYLFLNKNMLWVPQGGASNEYHNICFFWSIKKNINTFQKKKKSVTSGDMLVSYKLTFKVSTESNK